MIDPRHSIYSVHLMGSSSDKPCSDLLLQPPFTSTHKGFGMARTLGPIANGNFTWAVSFLTCLKYHNFVDAWTRGFWFSGRLSSRANKNFKELFSDGLLSYLVWVQSIVGHRRLLFPFHVCSFLSLQVERCVEVHRVTGDQRSWNSARFELGRQLHLHLSPNDWW